MLWVLIRIASIIYGEIMKSIPKLSSYILTCFTDSGAIWSGYSVFAQAWDPCVTLFCNKVILLLFQWTIYVLVAGIILEWFLRKRAVAVIHFIYHTKLVVSEQRDSMTNIIWAASWQNQQYDCAPSEDSDQPGHPSQSLRCPHEESLGPELPIWAHREDSDQTGQMPRLIWVFTGCTVILLVLSWWDPF